MTTSEMVKDLSTEHLTRMVFTEAGKAMLSAADVATYRDELFSRR